MDVQINNRLYRIERGTDEPDQLFYQRCWFMARQNPQTPEEFKKAMVLSYAWINHTTYNCEYPESVMAKISNNED